MDAILTFARICEIFFAKLAKDQLVYGPKGNSSNGLRVP